MEGEVETDVVEIGDSREDIPFGRIGGQTHAGFVLVELLDALWPSVDSFVDLYLALACNELDQLVYHYCYLP